MSSWVWVRRVQCLSELAWESVKVCKECVGVHAVALAVARTKVQKHGGIPDVWGAVKWRGSGGFCVVPAGVKVKWLKGLAVRWAAGSKAKPRLSAFALASCMGWILRRCQRRP